MKSRVTMLTIILAAVVAMSAGYWLSVMLQKSDTTVVSTPDAAQVAALEEARRKYSPIQGTVLSPARKIAVPDLIKDNGSTFTLDDLSGHWSLLFFGYTNCPDVCPVTMGVVAQASKSAAANDEVFPAVFFISVDPERDKVEMIGEYVRYFDKGFTGVTGDKDLIKALTLQMSVVYMKMPAGDSLSESGSSDSGYVVDHSSALLLIDPEGRLVAFLNPPHDPKTILKDIKKVISLQ